MSITLDTGQIFGALATISGAVVGALVTARKVVRPLLEATKDWRNFRDDWYGVADREGFPGHPGMGTRMLGAERDIRLIKTELVTNGGGSLKDAVLRIEAQQRVDAIHVGAPLVSLPQSPGGSGNHESEAA